MLRFATISLLLALCPVAVRAQDRLGAMMASRQAVPPYGTLGTIVPAFASQFARARLDHPKGARRSDSDTAARLIVDPARLTWVPQGQTDESRPGDPRPRIVTSCDRQLEHYRQSVEAMARALTTRPRRRNIVSAWQNNLQSLYERLLAQGCLSEDR
jgi:hypothetical protein